LKYNESRTKASIKASDARNILFVRHSIFSSQTCTERINSHEKEKNIYPLFGSSDDDRHHYVLFIGSTQKRKYGRSDSENHDDNDRKTHAPREADHHHNDRK
jgi:hypothetical protein